MSISSAVWFPELFSSLDVPPSLELDGSGWFTTRARLGTARFGRSGVGLRSMDSSLGDEVRILSESSSCSFFLFCGLLKADCVTEDARFWNAAGLVCPGVGVPQPDEVMDVDEEGPRPKPNPNGEGACATGLV